ncbi:putative membrane protein [Kriegella aquimaris]|uniref:Putative membrane protein n=2 Tax=Kriegella aquimaris TaxID=192904 RepID=A0A1G9NM50_9FLAO|nr:putative membrane protein [Kriegella aquimaris]
MAMGAADVVPGVSGGTIAFISGIYEELITSINNIEPSLFKVWKNEGFNVFWRKLNGNFLVALFLGIAISILSLAKFISWLLVNEAILLWSFFFGLVVASIFFVGKAIEKWNIAAVLVLLIGAALAYYITILPPSENVESLPFLFLSGALAVCAMILPGISGAFILVLLGSYKTILDAVHERNVQIIATVGLGAIFGLLSFAKLLKWMFNHYKNITLALLTGFILGSLNKIWPWKEVLETQTFGDKIITVKEQNISPMAFDGDAQITYAIIAAIIGFSLIFVLERTASKK